MGIHMLACMRTTLVLDDRLVRDAKRRAASRGMTLSGLVNEALQTVLAEPSATVTPIFEMITYGRGSPAVHREPAEMAAAQEEADRRALRG